jgi:hypothetical protein
LPGIDSMRPLTVRSRRRRCLEGRALLRMR